VVLFILSERVGWVDGWREGLFKGWDRWIDGVGDEEGGGREGGMGSLSRVVSFALAFTLGSCA
jgi:hypothetical protein